MPRVCLVTGASSGIGRATAHVLALRGEILVLAARREGATKDVAEECRELGAAAVTVCPTDVVDEEAVADLVAATLTAYGRIDAVLHCAGLVTYGRFVDTTAADFETVVDVNLKGAASVARHTLPVLRAQGSGTLLLCGSLLGHVAVPEMTAYVVSKWGVRALARQLKLENDDVPGVRIAYAAPGSVDTPIYDKALDDGGAPSRPPPPVMSAEQAAERIVRHLDGHRHVLQTAATNYVLIAGFELAPWVYDRTIGPAFRLLSRRAR